MDPGPGLNGREQLLQTGSVSNQDPQNVRALSSTRMDLLELVQFARALNKRRVMLRSIYHHTNECRYVESNETRIYHCVISSNDTVLLKLLDSIAYRGNRQGYIFRNFLEFYASLILQKLQDPHVCFINSTHSS